MRGAELAGTLPNHLGERVLQRNGEAGLDGDFVLCWLHHALRVDANPLIDSACEAAARLGLPVLFYQGLGGRHRFNADRHHRFILEAARDLAAALEADGHRLHFHLPAKPAEPGPLRSLAQRAALVVTELYPVPPFSGWYRSATAASPGTPWWFVDAACVVPMTLSRKRHDRAFAYRKAWAGEYESRTRAPWAASRPAVPTFDGDPGFEPFDLGVDLADAIAACAIDHSIGPIGHTRGGLRAARERWDLFRARGLGGYANQRNDAAMPWPKGVSRLSPYLHYGCLSALELAPALGGMPGRGPEKFLDELLIWRELAHHFCFRTPDPEALAALPAWAVDTLEAHASDPREQRLDWESLARGSSGSELWDLAQRSLLRQGELHNNLRMTWGKAVLDWTGGPDEALANLFDLNHRYALDGNDPNSYGGILWCLGQFDRPFSPEVSVTGTVRPRSVRAHERRLDVDAYRQKVEPPAGGRRLRCAVIGAGISGLTAARTLADHGHEVVVVEKGRGPGGRASTRRSDGLRFDHGAQYFTARDDRFRRHVLAWRHRGIVAPLTTPIGVAEGGTLRAETREHERWVGVPGMSAICATLAERLDCRFGWRVEALERGDRTTLTNDSGESLEADVVILTAPPIQAEALLADFPVALPRLPVLAPCWAVLAEFDRSLVPDFGGVFVNEGPLSWVSAMRERPGRPDREGWVLHASPAWSRKHLEDPADHVAAALLAAARAIPGAEAVEALETSAHRWRYAIADAPRHDGALWFEEAGLALCGDWLHGSRVEGAFLAGASAAGRVLGSRLALGR